MTSSLHSLNRDELNGGHVGSPSATTKYSTAAAGPMEPGAKPLRNVRFLSFRKKNVPAQLDSREAEKPLRRLSFKSLALTIQKFLVRVASPKSSESVASGLHTEKELPSPLNQANVSVVKPNWNSVFSGIRNHGNTCFLNAIIQCLSHTNLLAKYFVLGCYKEDLKRRRSQTRSSSGHGEVTERLAVLIKSLWTSRYSAEISSGFKTVVGKHGEQYKGTLQHDAQEFLLWLLDAVHEDVNRSYENQNKANKTPVLLHSDKSADHSAIQKYLVNNQSFILDIFQALLRSSLTCPKCEKQSITFDPYVSLSLPIPQRQTFPLRLTYIRPLPHKRHTRIAVTVNVKSHISDMLDTVAELMNVQKESLVLTEIYADSFRRTFQDNQMVTVIQNAHNLFVFELSCCIHSENPTLLMQSMYPKLATIAMLVVNCEIQANGRVRRFGAPFSLRLRKELNYASLQEAILKAMPNVQCCKPDGEVFRIRVCPSDGRPGCGFLTPEVDHPLYQNIVEESLKCCDSKSGPAHVKVIAEWSKDARERFVCFDASEKTYDIHPSVEQVESLYEEPWHITIDECLRLYTQEEKLSSDDAWFCPNCKQLQEGAKKQLHLHTVPDVLIIHLKRFKQLKTGRTKLHVMVDFPVEGLDMSHHMDKEKNSPNEFPADAASRSGEHIYDLYAVCNHLGSMSAGHYIAVCKNPVDGLWHSYDDFRVDRIPEEDIVTKSAYLLFYVRRSSSARAAPAFSSSPVSPDHWSFNVPNVSSDTLLQDSDNDSQPEEKAIENECPSFAEHYVSRKCLSDTHFTAEQPPYQYVMSESCV